MFTMSRTYAILPKEICELYSKIIYVPGVLLLI